MNTTPLTAGPRTVSVALALAGTLLAGCGTASDAADDPPPGEPVGNPITAQAAAYVGDAWEVTWRKLFISRTHVHDSWNPCHLGEDVPKSMKGHGPHCYDRLRSQTAR